MKVLVTGAAGFIGSTVRTRLRDAGHDVIGVDAFLPQAHPLGHPHDPGVERVDLRTDRDELLRLLDGVDVVCHQAAMVGAGTDTSDLPLYAGHNDLGIAVLLAAMADAKVDRLVLASSMVVYGDGRYRCDRHGVQHSTPRSLADLDAGRFEVACPVCGEPMRWQLVDEDAALRPLSAYAASKLAQENYTTAWTRQLPGRAVSLRYHNVYGPGVPADSPYSGVAAIFRSAIARGVSPRVFEDGLQMRDFVHVDDVARANLLAIEAVGSLEPGRHPRLNVCSGRPVSILDVARILVDESHPGLEARVTGESRPGDVRHIVADPARARAELGFTAQIRPEDGLRAFASDPMRPN